MCCTQGPTLLLPLAELDNVLPQLTDSGIVLPQLAQGLPPLLRMQMVDFLGRLTERI